MKASVLLLFIAFVLTSCIRESKKYTKAWLISADSFLGERGPDMQVVDLRGDGLNKPQFSSECFLNLKSGGRYTSYFSAYQQGKWKVTKDRLLLTPENGKPIEFEIRFVKKDTMILFYKDHQASYTFKGFSNQFESEKDDPFAPANNRWRVKAIRKESDKEINERLKNHFSFMEKYFAWGARKEVKGVPAGVISGPLELYGNGFALPNYDQQAILWRDRFYDDSDSRKAYKTVRELMHANRIAWKESLNKFETFADAFRQMEEWIQ